MSYQESRSFSTSVSHSIKLLFHPDPFCIDSKEYMDTTKPDSSDDDSDWESEDEPFTTPAITIGAQTRPVSEAEWYVMSTNPDSMIGRTFSLSNESGSDEDMAYEISGHRFRKGQGRTYEVRFTGCVDSIDVSEEELAQMIQSSYVV
jgi:hypothetical protein